MRKRKADKNNLRSAEFDFRKHVSLFGSLTQPNNRKKNFCFKKVEILFRERRHSELFELIPRLLSPKLYHCSRKKFSTFEPYLISLWQYYIEAIKDLNRGHQNLSKLISECNSTFEGCLNPRRFYFQLAQIKKYIERGQLEKVKELTQKLQRRSSEPRSLHQHCNMLTNVVKIYDDYRNLNDIAVASNASTMGDNLRNIQFDYALPVFKESNHFDWALPIHISQFQDQTERMNLLQKELQDRLLDDYDPLVHKMSLSKERSNTVKKIQKPHPLPDEVSQTYDQLESKVLQFDDLDHLDDFGGPPKKKLKSDENEQVQTCKKLTRQLVLLLEINSRLSSPKDALWTKLRFVMKHLMTLMPADVRSKWIKTQFGGMRLKVWKKKISNSVGEDFCSKLWGVLYQNLNVDSNPIAAEQKNKFVKLFQNLDQEEDTNILEPEPETGIRLSHDYCKYCPDFSVTIYKSIKVEREIAYIKVMEPLLSKLVLLKYSDENYLYSGDTHDSETRRFSYKFSQGHLKFVDNVYQNFGRADNTQDLSQPELLAIEHLKETFHHSLPQMMYETNDFKVGWMLKKHFEHSDRLIEKNTKFLPGTGEEFVMEQSALVSREWNRFDFERVLNDLQQNSGEISRRHSICKHQLLNICNKLKPLSKRYTLNHALAKLDCKNAMIKKIIRQQFEPLIQETAVPDQTEDILGRTYWPCKAFNRTPSL